MSETLFTCAECKLTPFLVAWAYNYVMWVGWATAFCMHWGIANLMWTELSVSHFYVCNHCKRVLKCFLGEASTFSVQYLRL